MNVIYLKGSYTSEKMVKHSCWKKFYLHLSFTVFGLLMMPVIDIFIKIEAAVNLVTCIYDYFKSKSRLNRKVHEQMDKIYERAFNLN